MYKLITLITAFLIVTNTAQAGVREDWQAVADAIASSGNTSAATKIEAAVGAISDEDLDKIYGNVNLNQFAENFRNSARDIETAEEAIIEAGMSRGTLAVGKSAGLPDAQGYPTNTINCAATPNRSDADAIVSATIGIQTSRVVLESAKGLWSGLSRACEQDFLGANASLACIPADIALFAAEILVGVAETVVETINACDGAVDAAEIEGSYERTGHIHADLTTHDTDIKTQVSAHDTNIITNLANHDANIAAKLAAHDAKIVAQLAAHDTDVKALLENLQGAVDENQRLIKVFMGRQLEVMRLLITPSGQREIDPLVLSCTGDDCPTVLVCSKGGLSWPCK